MRRKRTIGFLVVATPAIAGGALTGLFAWGCFSLLFASTVYGEDAVLFRDGLPRFYERSHPGDIVAPILGGLVALAAVAWKRSRPRPARGIGTVG